MYAVLIHPKAKKLFDKALKSGHPGIQQAMKTIVNTPERGKQLSGNLQNLRKLRKDPYRLVYSIDPETHTVTIYAIGTRDDIYDYLNEQIDNF